MAFSVTISAFVLNGALLSLTLVQPRFQTSESRELAPKRAISFTARRIDFICPRKGKQKRRFKSPQSNIRAEVCSQRKYARRYQRYASARMSAAAMSQIPIAFETPCFAFVCHLHGTADWPPAQPNPVAKGHSLYPGLRCVLLFFLRTCACTLLSTACDGVKPGLCVRAISWFGIGARRCVSPDGPYFTAIPFWWMASQAGQIDEVPTPPSERNKAQGRPKAVGTS